MNLRKNIKKLKSNPIEMEFKQIINILEFFNYKLARIKGSHYHFTKENKKIITIAVHQNKVYQFYLKIIKKELIKELKLYEENF